MKNNEHLLKKALFCAACFAAVGMFDYLTGYEVSSYPMYLMPIFLVFFNFGKVGGYIACVVTSVTWAMLDAADGHRYTHEVFLYWNAAARLIIYLLFVYGLSVYVKTIAVHRQRLEDVRRLIPMCHGCGRILWKDGTWKTPQEALESADADIPECPDCALAELEQAKH